MRRILPLALIGVLLIALRVRAAEPAPAKLTPLQKRYQTLLAKTEQDDPKQLLTLARWCHKNKLPAESVDCLQKALKLRPDSATIKRMLKQIRTAAWRTAPVGLLKKQRVPGYTDNAAWYHVAIPRNYKNTKKGMPLIILLHGGHHNKGSADNTLGWTQEVPFKKYILVLPNHLKTWWAHPRELMYLLDTLDCVMTRWHVNRKRIYLMGASMGGNGVWAWGSQCPELFAGLAPECGFYDDFLGFPMTNLKAKPIYVLHGKNDKVVPIDGARKAFNILKKEGANIVMKELDCDHQIPKQETTKAAQWIMRHSNKQSFDMKVLKERVGKLPVAKWLKQYEGN